MVEELGQAAGPHCQQRLPADGNDPLLEGLNLGCVEPGKARHRGEDELEGWFGAFPSWRRRR